MTIRRDHKTHLAQFSPFDMSCWVKLLTLDDLNIQPSTSQPPLFTLSTPYTRQIQLYSSWLWLVCDCLAVFQTLLAHHVRHNVSNHSCPLLSAILHQVSPSSPVQKCPYGLFEDLGSSNWSFPTTGAHHRTTYAKGTGSLCHEQCWLLRQGEGRGGLGQAIDLGRSRRSLDRIFHPPGHWRGWPSPRRARGGHDGRDSQRFCWSFSSVRCCHRLTMASRTPSRRPSL